MTVVTIVLSIACFIVGGFASYLFFKHGLKNKYDGILRQTWKKKWPNVTKRYSRQKTS